MYILTEEGLRPRDSQSRVAFRRALLEGPARRSTRRVDPERSRRACPERSRRKPVEGSAALSPPASPPQPFSSSLRASPSPDATGSARATTRVLAHAAFPPARAPASRTSPAQTPSFSSASAPGLPRIASPACSPTCDSPPKVAPLCTLPTVCLPRAQQFASSLKCHSEARRRSAATAAHEQKTSRPRPARRGANLLLFFPARHCCFRHSLAAP